MDYGIQKAQEKLDLVSIDWEALRNYELQAMALADYKAELKFAREEEKIEIAQNLKAMGLSVEQISQTTGLSFEEIEKLW